MRSPIIGDEWTAASVRSAARELRRLAWAWRWPAATVEYFDTRNQRAQLRAMRQLAAHTLDRMTRQAERMAAAGQIAEAADWLTRSVDWWERFETRATVLETQASETTLERTARYVDEATEAASAALARVAATTEALAQGVAEGASSTATGLAIAAAMVAFIYFRKGRA